MPGLGDLGALLDAGTAPILASGDAGTIIPPALLWGPSFDGRSLAGVAQPERDRLTSSWHGTLCRYGLEQLVRNFEAEDLMGWVARL